MNLRENPLNFNIKHYKERYYDYRCFIMESYLCVGGLPKQNNA